MATLSQMQVVAVADGAGGAIFAWADGRNESGSFTDVYAQRVNPAGAALWTTNGVPVCIASLNQKSLVIVPDEAGGAVIAWEDYRSSSYYADIYAQRIDGDGNLLWTANGVRVSTSSYEDTSPAAVSDGTGGALLVWRNSSGGLSKRRLSAAGAPQGSFPATLCSYPAGPPAMVPSGAGGAVVAWADARSAPTYRIFAQRLSPTGTDMWTVNGVDLCPTPWSMDPVALAADGFDGAIVAWHDYRNGNADIFAQRAASSNGAPLWTAEGVALTTNSQGQVLPEVAADGAGGAVVSWVDSRNGGTSDIYARRIDSGGNPQWGTDGKPVCTEAGDQQLPALVASTGGGVIVAWSDERAHNVYPDLYVQRLDGGGDPQWALGGVPVCTASSGPYGQSNPSLVRDGGDGVILAWKDGRGGAYDDIYAQRVGESPGAVLPESGTKTLTISPPIPNPTQLASTLRVSLPSPGHLTAVVYDLSGRCVRTHDAGWVAAGDRALQLELRDVAGRPLAGGLYFVRVEAAGRCATERLVILR